MELLEEITSHLEVEKSITTRWLANTFRIELQCARELLVKYQSKFRDVVISYLLAGTIKNGGFSCVVTSGNNLEKAKRNFSKLFSQEIYGIQLLNSAADKIIQQSVDYGQASELLMMSHPNSQDFLSNAVGHIRYTCLDIKPVGQRIYSTTCVAKVECTTDVKNSKSSSISKIISSKVDFPATKSSKSSIQATNFFSSLPETSSKAKSAPIKQQAAVKNENSTKITITSHQQAEKFDEEEEWEEDGGGGARSNKRNSVLKKENKTNTIDETASDNKIADASKSLDSDDAAEESNNVAMKNKKKRKGTESLIDTTQTTTRGATTTTTAVSLVRGAMDDYMEDIAIAEYNANSKAAAEGINNKDLPVVKRTKRQLVEKVSDDRQCSNIVEHFFTVNYV